MQAIVTAHFGVENNIILTSVTTNHSKLFPLVMLCLELFQVSGDVWLELFQVSDNLCLELFHVLWPLHWISPGLWWSLAWNISGLWWSLPWIIQGLMISALNYSRFLMNCALSYFKSPMIICLELSLYQHTRPFKWLYYYFCFNKPLLSILVGEWWLWNSSISTAI